MPKFIYTGAGHSLIVAGQALQRGMPTELAGRAAQEAAAHPDIHVAGDEDDSPTAPVWGTTVKDALAWVGDDRERAAEVLAAEQARGEDARSSILKVLETLLADEEDGAE